MTNPKDIVGQSKASTHCIPPVALLEMGAALHFGAYHAKRADGGEGYGPFNWREQRLRMNIYTDALMRHYLAFMDGQDRADDSKAHHLGHIMACCAIIMDAMELETMDDTRPDITGQYNKVAARIRDQNLDRAAAIMEAMANDPVDEGDLSQGTYGELAAREFPIDQDTSLPIHEYAGAFGMKMNPPQHTRETALEDGRSAINKGPWPWPTPDHIEDCFKLGRLRHPHCPGAALIETSLMVWRAGAANGQLAAHGLLPENSAFPDGGLYAAEAAKYGYLLTQPVPSLDNGTRLLTPSPLLEKHVLERCFYEKVRTSVKGQLFEEVIERAADLAKDVLRISPNIPREEWLARLERNAQYPVYFSSDGRSKYESTPEEIHDLAIQMLHTPRGSYAGLTRKPAEHDSAAWTGKD